MTSPPTLVVLRNLFSLLLRKHKSKSSFKYYLVFNLSRSDRSNSTSSATSMTCELQSSLGVYWQLVHHVNLLEWKAWSWIWGICLIKGMVNPEWRVTRNALLFSRMCLWLCRLKQQGYVIILYKYTVLLHPLTACGFFAKALCVLYGVPPSAFQSRPTRANALHRSGTVEFVHFRQCFRLMSTWCIVVCT